MKENMIDEITTTDLSEFGYREIKMAQKLLTAWIEQGLPDEFSDEKVQIMMNKNSGCVFLTNAIYDVAMMNKDKLELWYYTPYEGHEGFKEDLKELNREELNYEDVKYLIDIGVFEEEY